MIATLGTLSVLAALALTVGTVTAYLWGLVREQEHLLRFARYGAAATFVAVTVASVALMVLLATRDFSVGYVVQHTSTDLELGYTLAAFWAGQEGSLLLWTWLLAGLTVIVASTAGRGVAPRLADVSAAVLALLSVFFLALLAFVTTPFGPLHHVVGHAETLSWLAQAYAVDPAAVVALNAGRYPALTAATDVLQPGWDLILPPLKEGWGLNPQLQNIGMVFHPPSLYVGYVGFAVPFAYALAALILNQAEAAWFRRVRRWMLFSWLFLGLGIVLGAQWAYVELGWGGYWAWDPVENASLIPWLTATAYLHAGVVADQRGKLRRWSLTLLFATFVLTLVGTFLTRSGVIASVHAYAQSGLGTPFAALIGLATIVSLGLLAWRWRHLNGASEVRLLSRESGFLAASALFVALALAVLVGTLFPIVTQLAGWPKALTVSYYERVSAPLGMLIVALLGVCPALRWRKQTWPDLLRYAAVPAGTGLVAAGVAFFVGSREPFVMLAFGVCAFAIASAVKVTFLDWRRRNEAHDKGAGANLWGLLTGNRRRYGGYLVHIGVVLLVAGVVGSTVYACEKTVTLQKGERTTLSEYAIHFIDLDVEVLDNRQVIVRAPMTVVRGGSSAVLLPQMVFYPTVETPSSDPAIWGGLGQFFLEDFYVLMADLDPHGGRATFQMHVNPLMDWIWGGGVIMLLGSAWALWPGRRVHRKQGEGVAHARSAPRRNENRPP